MHTPSGGVVGVMRGAAAAAAMEEAKRYAIVQGEQAAAATEARPDGTSPTSVTASTRARESPVTHTPPSAPALAWLASVQSLLGCGACVR